MKFLTTTYDLDEFDSKGIPLFFIDFGKSTYFVVFEIIILNFRWKIKIYIILFFIKNFCLKLNLESVFMLFRTIQILCLWNRFPTRDNEKNYRMD